MAQREPSQREPGLHLHVRTTADTFELIAAAEIAHAPRLGLRRPQLTPDGVRGLTRAAAELSALLLDRQGGVLEAFGWPLQPGRFFDITAPGESGEFRPGRPPRPSVADRLWRLPIGEDAHWLLFARATLEPDLSRTQAEHLALRQELLALYYLKPGPLPEPVPLPIPLPPPGLPPVPWRLPLRWPWPNYVRYAEARHHRLSLFPNTPVVTLLNNGAPQDKFDIVVLAEGFQAAELTQFDAWCQLLMTEFLKMPAFAAVQHLLNIHAVKTASADSGVDDPTKSAFVNTALNVSSYFNGAAAPGYVGSNSPLLVYSAGALAAPLQDIDLFLVVVNASLSGGSAFPDSRMAFVTLQDSPAKFVNIAAHECAHAIAHLADEYITCMEKDPLEAQANQGTEAERAAGTLAWKGLALPGELSPTGRFLAQHVHGDPMFTTGTGYMGPIEVPGLQGSLGAFWGCQNTNAALTTGYCRSWDEPDGKDYFRPMAACRMRRSPDPFCRVCDDAIRRHIDAIAT